MNQATMKDTPLRFIDLFAGMGGIRLGFEQACEERGIATACMLTSELKPAALQTLAHNFTDHHFQGDICQIETAAIPDFDFLFAGFPCQPFSSGGKRHGFADTRGTLFFEIERILAAKRPMGFILENVEGLVKHDLQTRNAPIGRTLQTILYTLREKLGYQVSWKVLDAADFGVAQSRRRIFIVGTKNDLISLDNFPVRHSTLSAVLENGLPTMDTPFVTKLLAKYSIEQLHGKSIKDKRGGQNNIHSWDIGLKGACSEEQIVLLNKLFKERRRKQWAAAIGLTWMDGIPLTHDQIATFYNPSPLSSSDCLQALLDDLVNKGYLKFEHPKELIIEQSENGTKSYRKYDTSKPKGYNIVTGKLSFEINKILDPNGITPTLVATDMARLAVPDGNGLRRLTKREGLRLCGYPESYVLPVREAEANDLLGNTVVVPVIKAISERIIHALLGESLPESEVESRTQQAIMQFI